MHLKLLQKKVKKTAKATAYLIENTIDDKITKVSRTSPQNSSETVAKERENVVLDRENKKNYIYISRKKTANLCPPIVRSNLKLQC